MTLGGGNGVNDTHIDGGDGGGGDAAIMMMVVVVMLMMITATMSTFRTRSLSLTLDRIDVKPVRIKVM